MQQVAVIGLGRMGRVHLRNYIEMPDVRVAGVVDVDPVPREDVRKRFGVPVFEHLEDLLAQSLDAVSVCVPTSLHHVTGLAIISAGVPLLMEKPLAATVEQGRELVAAAAAGNVPLMVGHIERYNSAVQRLKELVDDDIVSLSIERVGPYPARIQDVGVVKDLGPHDIDLVRHITGSEFRDVFGVSSVNIGRHEDTAFLTGRMENGALASISLNWVTPFRSRRIRVACRSRCFEANLITQEVREYSGLSSAPGYAVREWTMVAREPVKAELTDFLAALREGQPMPISGLDGLKVLEIIDRAFPEV